MAAGLEHVHETDDVAVDVGVGVLQRVAHAGLRGQVDDALGRELAERGVQRRAILQRRPHEPEAGVRQQPVQPRLFQPGVVVAVEVVVSEHFVAALEQAFAQT